MIKKKGKGMNKAKIWKYLVKPFEGMDDDYLNTVDPHSLKLEIKLRIFYTLTGATGIIYLNSELKAWLLMGLYVATLFGIGALIYMLIMKKMAALRKTNNEEAVALFFLIKHKFFARNFFYKSQYILMGTMIILLLFKFPNLLSFDSKYISIITCALLIPCAYLFGISVYRLFSPLKIYFISNVKEIRKYPFIYRNFKKALKKGSEEMRDYELDWSEYAVGEEKKILTENLKVSCPPAVEVRAKRNRL